MAIQKQKNEILIVPGVRNETANKVAKLKSDCQLTEYNLDVRSNPL